MLSSESAQHWQQTQCHPNAQPVRSSGSRGKHLLFPCLLVTTEREDSSIPRPVIQTATQENVRLSTQSQGVMEIDYQRLDSHLEKGRTLCYFRGYLSVSLHDGRAPDDLHFYRAVTWAIFSIEGWWGVIKWKYRRKYTLVSFCAITILGTSWVLTASFSLISFLIFSILIFTWLWCSWETWSLATWPLCPVGHRPVSVSKAQVPQVPVHWEGQNSKWWLSWDAHPNLFFFFW